MAIIFSIVALALRYAVLPSIENHQADIISRVAIATGMDVSARTIRGGWAGFRPYVELEDVYFFEPASSTSTLRPAGAVALKLPNLTAGLSWWSLLIGQIRFADVVLDGPELVLNRDKDGLIYFAGHALNQPKSGDDDGQLITFLLGQPGLEVRHASLTWSDDLTPGSTLRFADVGLYIQKNGSSHQLGFTATPPIRLARKIEASGDLRLDNVEGRWLVKGTLFVAATDASLTELRQHAPVPDVLQSGTGNLRTWIEIDNTIALSPAIAAKSTSAGETAPTVATFAAFNPVRAITADLHLTNARVQLDTDLVPLNFAKLAGRVEYTVQEGGYTVGSKALEIRTREGVVLPAADFSLTLQNQADAATAKGAVSGNGIDLKVMAALIESFPAGKELRNFVARYQPRGEVINTSFAWSGYLDKPNAYQIKGSLNNFGMNSDGKNPGVTNFSGTIEGDEKGGKFSVASKSMGLDDPLIFRAPLKFDHFDSAGKWRVTNDAIEVDLSNVNFANADLAGEFSGVYSRFRAGGARAAEEKGPGSLDIKGKFSRVKAVTVGNYLPNGIGQTRSYLERALQAGEMSTADFAVKGELYEFPFHHGKGGTFTARAAIKEVDFRYNDDWPTAKNINGEMSFDNTKFGLTIESAKILNTPIKRSTIVIADLADKTGVIAINLAADARAEEVTKFLRESPLANSVGGFTKVVAIDGFGKLDLGITIPIVAGRDVIKVNGKYALLRATAKPTIGPTVTNLTGMIAFTEHGVQSASLSGPSSAAGNALQGIAYGNPVAITISGGGEAGVTAEFTTRADMTQLADVLPFRLPQQVSGAAEFRGKILTKAGATEIAIDSNLAGVTSTLPYPLAKHAAEPRQLRVQFLNAAKPAERIRVTLAGNTLTSTGTSAATVTATAAGPAPALMPTTASADQPETRIDARFQRRFDATGVPVALSGGVATIGEAATEVPIPEGVWLAGRLQQFDLDLWRAAIEGFYPASPIPTASASPKSESPIAGFDFKLGSLLAYGRQFGAMSLKGRHGGEDWRFVVDSPEALGDFTWKPGAFNDRGSVRARLKNFVLVDEAINPVPAVPEVNKEGVRERVREADFPALDIVAEQFTLKDRWMGKLELRAIPQGANWKIEQLTISNGHVKLNMDGIWQRLGDPDRAQPTASNALNTRSRTIMNIKLESSNLNALFAQFGFGDYLRGGTGSLEGKLAWPGHVYQMQLANLSGEFKVGARNGQFAKIEPGAGKLLGLISLQSLPRRITLDFRDIFSQGFAFNSIDGDVSVKDGIMFTENFQVVGPAADVRMAGDISLPSERQNLTMTVLPKLDESVAIGAGLATLNPVVGLAVYLGQKILQNPVEKIFSYQYAVSGSWDNPQVDRINKNGAPIPSVNPAIPATIPAPLPPSTFKKSG